MNKDTYYPLQNTQGQELLFSICSVTGLKKPGPG